MSAASYHLPFVGVIHSIIVLDLHFRRILFKVRALQQSNKNVKLRTRQCIPDRFAAVKEQEVPTDNEDGEGEDIGQQHAETMSEKKIWFVRRHHALSLLRRT